MTISERLRADDLLYNRGADYEPLLVKPSAVRIEAADTIDALVAALKRMRSLCETGGDPFEEPQRPVLNQVDAALALARGGQPIA